MAKAKFDIKTEATRQFYAGVGVTDLAVEAVREYVTDLQKKLADVQKSINKLEFQPQALREQALKDAKVRRDALEARIAELQADAKAYPAKVQALVNENVSAAGDAYGDLVKRGETLVGRIRRQQSTQATKSSAKTTSAKAKTTKTQASKGTKSTAKKTTSTAKSTAAKKSTAPKSSAKATTTAAQKTASNAAQATSDAASKVGD